jgi:hypothetical protein
MSQQGLSLRRSAQIVRRHKILVASTIVLGLLVGGGYSTRYPPMLTGKALVALLWPGPGMNTELVVATSDPVLSAALPRVTPGMSLETLRDHIQAKSVTSNIMAISASSKNATEAEITANAVANSYIAYVDSKHNPIGHVSARMLQPAIVATGTTPLKQTTIFAFLGGLAGAIIGFIIALAVGRGDRRLRKRDDIADSIGVPVIASLPAEQPSDAPGWTRLLADYEPGVVYAWRLRKALQQLGITDIGLTDGGRGSSLTVLSLSSDRAALALGPQFATFAASLGIPTTLVIGPQQDTNAAAALRTACAASLPSSTKRATRLRVIVSENANLDRGLGATLLVSVVVVDGRAPEMPDTVRTTATVLAVSAGAATGEQLARAATVAAGDGRDVVGILVANPDPADQTTGRIPRLGRATKDRAPTRVRGIPTEIRR